ncbi:hypothetical protein ACS0TY_026558 [Phlomoides rotata]
MVPPMKTFQLLEINIISAQDLEPVSKKMKTYATACMNPKRKLSSCVDAEGHTNPTWNDKFVFRVEEEFLRRDTSAVMIEIYADHWFRDILIGTVRVLVGNLVPPPDIRSQHNGYIGMRFVALQVGPSPSEVAAAVMAERRYPLEDNQSSVLDGWSMDESVEGLRSKLERWRMELPPLYDRGGYSTSSYKSSSYRTRKNVGNNEVGLFSCFGNFFGYECQCVCGKPPGRKVGGRFNTPSTTPGRSFI